MLGRANRHRCVCGCVWPPTYGGARRGGRGRPAHDHRVCRSDTLAPMPTARAAVMRPILHARTVRTVGVWPVCRAHACRNLRWCHRKYEPVPVCQGNPAMRRKLQQGQTKPSVDAGRDICDLLYIYGTVYTVPYAQSTVLVP